MICRSLMFLLLLSALYSCSKKNNIPPGIIPPAQMQELIWDLNRADQFTQDLVLHDSSKNAALQNKILYSKVFAIHHTTPVDFEKSYNFYKYHPDLIRVMLDSLQAQKTRLIEHEAMEIYKPKKDTSSIKEK